MATDVETLLVKLEARITDFEKGMDRARSKANSTANGIQARFDGLGAGLRKTAGLIGISLGVGFFTHLIKGAVEAGAAIGDLSHRLGISAEEVQKLSFAASQSGSSQEALVQAFTGMTKVLGEAQRGSKQARAEFTAIGLSWDQLKGQSPVKIFETLLDRIGRIRDPLQRNAELIKFFGKSGQDMAQLAEAGARGVEHLKDQAVELGLVLSGEQIAQLKEAGDKIDIISLAAQTAGERMAAKFLPAITKLEELVTSQSFQDGLVNMAEGIGSVLKFLIDNAAGIEQLAKFAVIAKFFGGAIAAIATLGPEVLKGTVLEGGLSATDQPFSSDAAAAAAGRARQRGMDVAKPGSTTPKTIDELWRQAFGTNPPADKAGPAINPSFVSPEAAAKAAAAAKKIADETDKLKFLQEQLGRTAREQAIYNAVHEAGVTINTKAGKAIAEQAARNFDLEESIKRVTDRMDLLRESARTALSTFVTDLRQGKSAVDALSDALDRVLDRLLDKAFDNVIEGLLGKSGTGGGGSLLGGFFANLFGGVGGSTHVGIAGNRAGGGRTRAGRSYLVGEEGPELWTPGQDGWVTPSGGGKGAIMQIVDQRGSRAPPVETRRTRGPNGEEMIRAIIRDEMATPASEKFLSQKFGLRPSVTRR